MRDQLWDFFVDLMVTLFLPLVCSYFTLSANIFLTVSNKQAQGLEWAANQLLAPVQYLLAGQEAVQKENAEWEFTQRFCYKNHFWIKTTSCALTAFPSLVLGSVVKGLSFLTPQTREQFHQICAAKNSIAIDSNESIYRQIGILTDESEEFVLPLGFQRKPGDENKLAVEKKAMREITQLLNQAHIPWWVDCGTCLGAYRYGGAIPWDEDIDLAVLQIDFDNIIRTLNQLDKKKYRVQDWSTREHPKSFIKVYIRESNTMIDIYHFAIHPEQKKLEYIFSLETHIFFPEWFKIRERRFKTPVSFSQVFPLKKMVFDGLEVFVPNDVKSYLQRCYGNNLDPVKVYNPKTDRYEKDLLHPYWQTAYVH